MGTRAVGSFLIATQLSFSRGHFFCSSATGLQKSPRSRHRSSAYRLESTLSPLINFSGRTKSIPKRPTKASWYVTFVERVPRYVVAMFQNSLLLAVAAENQFWRAVIISARSCFRAFSQFFRMRLAGFLKVFPAITWIAPSSDPRRHAFPSGRSDLRQLAMKV